MIMITYKHLIHLGPHGLFTVKQQCACACYFCICASITLIMSILL